MSTLSARQPESARSAPWRSFHCGEDPFRTAFDDRFVYLSHTWRDALARLHRDLSSPKGLSLITGPAGTGKTTLLRKLVASLQRDNPFVLLTDVPVPTLDALVEIGRRQAGLVDEEGIQVVDPASAFRGLLSHLDPRRVRLLVIDEAQSLPDQLLDQLRTLAKPAEDESSLLPIILAGDPSLALRLEQAPSDEQGCSLGHRLELDRLDRTDVMAFIRHRLEAADCADGIPFTADAIERIGDYADGIPGTINTLCRLAFFFGAEQGETRVTADSVELAASAVLLNHASRHSRLASSPIGPRDPTASASAPRPSALGVGESAISLQSDANHSPTLSPAPAANLPPRPFDGAKTVNDPFGQTSAEAGRPRQSSPQDRRVALAWAAATVTVVLGAALLIPRLYDAHWELWPPRGSTLVALLGTGSANPQSASATPEPMPLRLGGIVPPGSSASFPTLDGSQGNAESAGILPQEEAKLDEAEIGRLLALAERHFRADRLVAPRFDNALATYRQVLRADSENSAALAGIAAIKSKLMGFAQAEEARGDHAGARRQLDKIRLIEPESQAGISQIPSPPSVGDDLYLANPAAGLATQ